MRGKIFCFDTLAALLTLALFFSIGYGIGSFGEEHESELLTVEISLTVKKGDFKKEEAPMIDGVLPARLLYLDSATAYIELSATETGAGWLLPSGKYISENQPLKYYSASSYLEGRIKRISKSAKNDPS